MNSVSPSFRLAVAARIDRWVHHRLTGESLDALAQEAR